MNKERRKILEMLSDGKISVDEAERLLTAVSDNAGPEEESVEPGKLKYLRVLVEPVTPDGERVNVRVPLNLIRAGLKWAALIPKHAQSKVNDAFHAQGIDMDFSDMTKGDIEELISNLGGLTVDVEGKEKVKVFCE